MLAFVVFDTEDLGATSLWHRVAHLCPQVFKSITGEEVTLEAICQRTLEQQGLEITSNKLYGRAYHAANDLEWNDTLPAVEASYKEVVQGVVA